MRRSLLLFRSSWQSLLLAPALASAGGFATVGLSSTPDGVGTGKPWKVDITVLQHGRTPLDWRLPRVQISSGEATREFAAKPTGKTGVYRAEVVFPSAGRWEYVGARRLQRPAAAHVPRGAVGDGAASPAAPSPAAPASAPAPRRRRRHRGRLALGRRRGAAARVRRVAVDRAPAARRPRRGRRSWREAGDGRGGRARLRGGGDGRRRVTAGGERGERRRAGRPAGGRGARRKAVWVAQRLRLLPHVRARRRGGDRPGPRGRR